MKPDQTTEMGKAVVPLMDFLTPPSSESFSLSSLAHATDLFHLLICAMDLDIFENLQNGLPSDELSQKLDLDPRLTEKVLKALASEEILTYKEGTYLLSPIAKTYLQKNSPYYQGHLLELYRNTRINRWNNLEKALKRELDPVPFVMNNAFNPSFIHAMAEGAVSGQIQATITALKDEPWINQAETLLDLGGGHGLYAIAFAQMNPHLTATVMDLPQVISGATEPYINAYTASRVRTISGDYTQEDIKGPYDVIFASDTLYRPADEVTHLLSQFSGKLSPNGVIISKHWHIDDLVQDKTAVWFDLMMSIQSPDERIHSSQVFSDCFQNAGLEVIKKIPLNHTAKPTTLTISRRINT